MALMAPPDPTSLDVVEATANVAVTTLPAPFATLAASVLLRVEDWPSVDVLHVLGVDDPLNLTGLYDSTPLTVKSVSGPALWPDRVWH